jgi:hypothetical protein
VHGVRHSGPLNLPRHAGSLRRLTADGLREVVATAHQLEMRHNIHQPTSTQDLALHRFAAGVARGDAADAVLDFTIALEGLLLPYDEDTRRSELAYRFRLHGAHYISDSPGERRDIFNQLRAVYDLRSRLVHGGDYPAPVQIRDIRIVAHDLARRGLLRAVREGFPKAEAFNKMMLRE